MTKFLSARKVTGGGIFKNERLGKTVRFYSSTTAMWEDPYMHYALNGNKIPKSSGCRPLMNLGEGLPDDLHYEAYINEAKNLLLEIGWKEKPNA